MSHIEDSFVPETVNEVLLLNRIRELKIIGYEKGADYSWNKSLTEQEIVVAYRPSPVMHLAAEVESGWETDAHFYIRSQSYGPDKASLGYQVWQSQETLQGMQPGRAAQWLGYLHKDLIHRLAKVLG